MNDFRKLEVWKRSMLTAQKIYTISDSLPPKEKYNLISQIQRCSVSIPSNIAEGTGRKSNKDFGHFLNISLGSAYELETLLLLIQDLYSIKDENLDGLIRELHVTQKMIFRLRDKVYSKS